MQPMTLRELLGDLNDYAKEPSCLDYEVLFNGDSYQLEVTMCMNGKIGLYCTKIKGKK